MAAKPHFQLPATILVFALAFAALANASGPNSSPLGFLKQLKGCHKGEKVKGINQLKNYLENFGYVHYDHSNKSNSDNDDEFDDLLEAAVKTYQTNFHLHPTGVLDDETVSTMSMPRCGCPDIVNGTNTIMERSSKHGRHLGSFKTVSHFAFFPNRPRWPAGKTHLTYGFALGTLPQFSSIIAGAYTTWAANSHFRFSEVNFNRADMKVSFRISDGRGSGLARAWAPTNGTARYDIDENWAVGVPNSNQIHLESVALHEIGHQLGLDHSDVREAIMWPNIDRGEMKGLRTDDIQGIRTLYGVII